MLKRLIKLASLTIVILIVALLAYAATRPDTLHVQRSTLINAPPDRIFPLIIDFHRWGAWSPYEQLDPAMKRTYSGSTSGSGAVTWAMDGPTPYVGKLMGVFFNMDSMIGDAFSTGLRNLKTQAEK